VIEVMKRTINIAYIVMWWYTLIRISNWPLYKLWYYV